MRRHENFPCNGNVNLPFVTQYHPPVPNLKQILMQNWHLIQQQPLLRRIFKYPPIFSYKRGRSLNKEVTQFIKQANSHHLTIKFTAEVSGTETTFLDKNVYKGERFAQQSRLHIKTHFKATKRFQYTHFSSYHPLVVKKGFRSIQTPSSKPTPLKQHLKLLFHKLKQISSKEGILKLRFNNSRRNYI